MLLCFKMRFLHLLRRKCRFPRRNHCLRYLLIRPQRQIILGKIIHWLPFTKRKIEWKQVPALVHIFVKAERRGWEESSTWQRRVEEETKKMGNNPETEMGRCQDNFLRSQFTLGNNPLSSLSFISGLLLEDISVKIDAEMWSVWCLTQ